MIIFLKQRRIFFGKNNLKDSGENKLTFNNSIIKNENRCEDIETFLNG